MIWDGASYHKSDEVKNFLETANDRHEQDQWQITCIRFAPNAPEQNPVEDVWLQAKNFVRENSKAHLTAFSTDKNVKVSDNDEIWSFEWDCPVSRIKIVQNALIKL